MPQRHRYALSPFYDRLLPLLLSLCLGSLAQADDGLDTLAQQPYWHQLLHLQAQGRGWRSTAHGPGFFLAAQGAHDPAAELRADLQAFQGPAQGDQSPACLLPARYAWLQQQLGRAVLPKTPDCPQLQTWLHALAVRRLTLVFASDYVNNPSSMFGHTFLRLDSQLADQDPLLTYAISYAAATHESNGLLFAVKGLTGGYPGMYSLLPYYDKVKQYNDFENRDLWEYGLDLDPSEIQRILLHIWELRQTAFPYYFFTDNCAYELLKLLEIGRPTLHLSARFTLYAIPADTVRAIIQVPGLVLSRHYRPAQSTRLAWRVRDNSSAVNDAALRLYHDPARPVELDQVQAEAQALETAFDALKLSEDSGRLSGRAHPGQDLSLLLRRRARIDLPDQFIAHPAPDSDPSLGHDSSHLLFAAGSRQGATFDLGLRPAYHDLSDSAAGYRRGASIDFLDLDQQYRQADRRLHLGHATLLAIQSLTPSLPFQPALSWQMGISAQDLPLQNRAFDANASHILLRTHGGVGFSWQPDAAWQTWALADAQSLSGAGLDGTSVGLGPDMGLSYQAGRWQLLLEESLHRQASMGWLDEPQLSLDHRWARDSSLRLYAQRIALHGQQLIETGLAWIHDF